MLWKQKKIFKGKDLISNAYLPVHNLSEWYYHYHTRHINQDCIMGVKHFKQQMNSSKGNKIKFMKKF